MKFSERWLRTLVDPPLDTPALAEILTMAGLEVESLVPAAPPFTGVVVARIEAVAAHPNADKLRVCTVDAGGTERLQIVCGAPNAAAGMLAPCALEGASLPGGLVIKRTVVRGVESRGMLCSAQELGLSDDAAGLLQLAAGLQPGSRLREALELDDTIIELKITPNRADCLSVLGVARDVAAMTGAPLATPPGGSVPVASKAAQSVVIEDFAACPRFASRMIEGIDAKAPTPGWMRQRLERSGLRSISAVVDVTNYVMLELGQPLHAYDARQLDGDVVVRFARPGETLTLLNGDVLELAPDLLLVGDAKKPLGLAGIMGGEHSGIGDDTSTVFLEGAFWNPAVIQGRMRRLGFTSDAGYRFERGVDFDLGPRAVERATQLILEICGGRAGALSDVKGALPPRVPVRVRSARVARLLGIDIPPATIASVFARLGFEFSREGGDFTVTPPAYRFDLAIEEDFVEEVARIHGYDAIPAEASAHLQHMLPAPETALPLPALRTRLAARDWQEVVTFSFVDADVERALDPAGAPVAVLNPIAEHLDAMRTTLLPGLIGTLCTNLARQATRVRIFETGRTFRRTGTAIDQPLSLGLLASGAAQPEQWGTPPRTVDLYDVKADLAALFAPRRLTTVPAPQPFLHPGRAAQVLVEGVAVGWLGELHPRLARRFDLPRPPVVAGVDLGAILARSLPAGGTVSRMPIVRRDLALVVEDAVPAQALVDELRAAAPSAVVAIELFDVYRGAGLTNGKKSLAILVLMQDTSRTLTDADIDATLDMLLVAARKRFGATLRNQGSR